MGRQTHRHEHKDDGWSRERVGFEIQRSLHSCRKGMALAVLPLQIGAFALVAAKGAGKIYLDMLPLLILITLLSCFMVSFIHGNQKILLLSLILLTVGTMLQSIFKQEAALKNPDLFSSKTLATGLQVQYIVAFLAALILGFCYWNLRECSSLKVAEFLTIFMVALSFVTLILAKSVGNVKNWLSIGGFSFQTTELVKILYVFIVCALLGTVEKPDRKRILWFYGITFLLMGIFALQSEFGTLLLVLMVFFTYLFMFVDDLRIFLLTILGFAGMGGIAALIGNRLRALSLAGSRIAANPLARKYLSNYMKIANRFIYWQHPDQDPLGMGYQLIMARKSIVLGGWFGTASVTDLPVKTSDMVYPALIQRCGMIFALLVFLVFIMLWMEGMRACVKKKDRYHRMMAVGLISMFIDQSIIIIAGSTGLCPLTGITLPFISSGGSSLVVSFMQMSLLLCISGKISWKGQNSEEIQFFKKSTVCAGRVLAACGHYVRILVQNVRTSAGNLRGSGSAEGGSQAGTVREGIRQRKHSRQKRKGNCLDQ